MSKKLLYLPLIILALAFGVFAQNEISNQDALSERPEVSPAEAIQNALKIGDRIPEFSLFDTKGNLVSSADLLQKSNLAIVFYRGAWDADGNAYLQKLQQNIALIRAQGANVIVIANEPQVRSQMVAGKYKVRFTVLSDPNLLVSKKFGVVYDLPAEINRSYRKNGLDLAVYNMTETVELPLSATYVVDRNGQIISASIASEFKNSTEITKIIEFLSSINNN